MNFFGNLSPHGDAWAVVRLRDEVDRRMRAVARKIRLRPDEWKSGDNYWLVDTVGSMPIVLSAMRELNAGVLKEKTVWLLSKDLTGALVVKSLADVIASSQSEAGR